MSNPFTIERLSTQAAFCDRQDELTTFERYAEDNLKVVLFSPRRFGKTSLLLRVQDRLMKKGFVCAYADFSTVTTVRGVAEEIMQGLFSALHRKESLLEKGTRYLRVLTTFKPIVKISETGYKLTVAPDTNLDDITLFRQTVKELAAFVTNHDVRCCFIMDEFQELTRLRETAELEGILRSNIQGVPASFFFLGSRRSVLLAMFNDKKRPFFKLARNEELAPLPEDDVVVFLQEQFTQAGKTIPEDIARRIAMHSRGHAYYMQYVAQELFYMADTEATLKDLERAEEAVLAKEQYGFAGIIQGLPLQQLRLLKTLAQQKEGKLTSARFIGRSEMAASTIVDAQHKLLEQDLIEKDASGAYRVVDPFLARWLTGVDR
ncbi:AAA family ATPase [Desulfovibrio inopinatus]|uniref:AAA family ATPase n=1 Tax=Desulfovibrio inopinatus TaxID=102109 RepID=UPI000413B63C|nr:ATP-binding protein [Desulfovibrio inopinatus]